RISLSARRSSPRVPAPLPAGWHLAPEETTHHRAIARREVRWRHSSCRERPRWRSNLGGGLRVSPLITAAAEKRLAAQCRSSASDTASCYCAGGSHRLAIITKGTSRQD